MTGPRKQSILTPYGRRQVQKLFKGAPWAATVLTILLSILLSGCVTAGAVQCSRLPDGKLTCSGEVTGR